MRRHFTVVKSQRVFLLVGLSSFAATALLDWFGLSVVEPDCFPTPTPDYCMTNTPFRDELSFTPDGSVIRAMSFRRRFK